MTTYEIKYLKERHQLALAILEAIEAMRRREQIARENLALYTKLSLWNKPLEQKRLDTIRRAIKRLEDRYWKCIKDTHSFDSQGNIIYRGFIIDCICPPIPTRDNDYHFFPDGDEEGDSSLQGWGDSVESCKKQIDSIIQNQ